MSGFSRYHPFVLFLYFVFILFSAMFLQHPVLLALSFIGAFSYYLTLSKGKDLLKETGFYLFIFLMAAATNPLFSHAGKTPLFFLNGNPVTLQAFYYGAAIGAMLINVILWFKIYALVMDSDKFLFLFGKAAPKFSLILSVSLRFIPLFTRQTKKIAAAQKSLGLYTGKSYLDKIKMSLQVFSAMITWSLENAATLSESMKARGYGLKGRSHFSLFAFYKHDAFMILLMAVFILLFFVGAAAKGTDFFYYPDLSRFYTGRASFFAFVSYGSLCFIPALIEIKEIIKWSYFTSKI